MNVSAFVKKVVPPQKSILEDLFSGAFSKTKLILIIDSTFNTGDFLLRQFNDTVTIDASKLGKMGLTGNVVLLKDLTIELLKEDPIPPLLFELSRNSCTFIADIQGDILPRQVINSLKYYADVILDVFERDQVHVTRRMPGGKVSSETCKYLDGEFISLGKDASPMPSPTSDLPTSTFNLGITAEQAAVKASIILPHLRVQSESSKPILAGDYDEEDPDDDLEI